MSLEAMLSAIRTLILDRMDVPESPDERSRFFRASFPGLSKDEVSDLAQITPSKFSIYTKTIFAGERSVLQTHFPITFGLLRSRFDDKLDPFELVRDLHEKRPWKSYLTAGLAANFAKYVVLDRPDFVAKIPEIGDVANIERLTVAIARGKDPKLDVEQMQTADALDKLTVGDLMEQRAIFPPYVRKSSFEYDVPALRDEFWANDRTLPEHPAEMRPIFALGGRTRTLSVEWQPVSQPVFDFAERFKEESFSLGDFAESVLAGEDDSLEESLLFVRYLETLKTAMANGIVIVLA